MIRVRACVPLCGLVALVTGCARETAPDGPTLLGRGHRAETTLCYTSEEVNEQVLTGAWPRNGAGRSSDMLMYGRPVTTLVERIQCGPEQRRYEIKSTDAPGARVARTVTVQNGSVGWRFSPTTNRIDLLTFPATDMGPLNWLALVLLNYDVRDIHKDRVAGVPAWYLCLQPKHPSRPAKRMWLAADTYLPLRQELWSPDGRLVSVSQVLRPPREVDPSKMASLEMPVREDMGSVTVAQGDQDWQMAEPQLSRALGYPLGHIGWVPEGFMVAGTYLYVCPDTLGRCARWELTDGVATVNVIQTRVNVRDMDGFDTPQDVQGPIETVRIGNYHFIVRGNLPVNELKQIAESITITSPRPSPKASLAPPAKTLALQARR